MAESSPHAVRVLLRKLRSARARMDQFVARRREAAIEREKGRSFSGWIDSLRASPPDVLVGSNFAEYGGVRHHIQAIERYSALDVRLAPPESLLRIISPHEVKTRFREEFLDFHPDGIKSVHSHVFPWFIKWCHEQRGRAQWIHTYHVPYFAEYGRNGLEPWQQEINRYVTEVARHADVRISVSKWQQRLLSGEHGIDTIYIPNGVDVPLCDAADPERFVRRVGFDDFVLYVGRNDPVKDPASFIRLAIKMPSTRFVMIGRGLTAEAVAADYGLQVPRNVTLMGELSHSGTLDALSACTAVVVTSPREGMPTLVLEAMTLQKKVVVPDEPGSLEATADGRHAFVYRHGELDDLVAKTERAIGDTSRREEARQHVLAEYDWRVIAKKLDDIYRC